MEPTSREFDWATEVRKLEDLDEEVVVYEFSCGRKFVEKPNEE